MKPNLFPHQFMLIENLTDESKTTLVKEGFNLKRTINDSHKFPLCDASNRKIGEFEMTPLEYAIMEGNVELVAELMDLSVMMKAFDPGFSESTLIAFGTHIDYPASTIKLAYNHLENSDKLVPMIAQLLKSREVKLPDDFEKTIHESIENENNSFFL